jgi:hypothetical protein
MRKQYAISNCVKKKTILPIFRGELQCQTESCLVEVFAGHACLALALNDTKLYRSWVIPRMSTPVSLGVIDIDREYFLLQKCTALNISELQNFV